MRHIFSQEGVFRISVDSNVLGRVYRSLAHLWLGLIRSVCWQRPGTGYRQMARREICHWSRNPSRALALSGGTGGGASFKAIPFQTGPAGSPPNSPNWPGGDLRWKRGPVPSETEPAETPWACHSQIITSSWGNLLFTLPNK